MITIQRVRVRWGAAARGAPHADRRRGLSRPAILPPALPAGDVVIHDALADEAAHYVRRDEVFGGSVDRAHQVDLGLAWKGSALVVDRLPGLAAYPRLSRPARLFVLQPGQTGRFRANFRFTVTQCPCDPSWYYEDWLVHVSHGETKGDGFVECEPDQDVDRRVHLYGGSARSATGGRRVRR